MFARIISNGVVKKGWYPKEVEFVESSLLGLCPLIRSGPNGYLVREFELEAFRMEKK